MGIKALRKIQYGFETTAGVAVPATAVWPGGGILKDTRVIARPAENPGVLAPTSRTYIPKLAAELELEEVEATFEHLPVLLSAAIEQVESGVQDGAGSDYVYQFDCAVSSVNDTSSLTIEGGDDTQAWEMEYAKVQELELKGAAGEALTVSATLIGRQITETTFTDGLSLGTAEPILFQRGKLYIDDSGGTVGTTQITNSWLGFSLTIPSGIVPRWTGDGQKYFSFARNVGHKEEPITGELTLEFDANGLAELRAAQAGSVRLVRMLFEGSDVSTPGTSYTKKTLQIDMAIVYTEVPSLDDEDGNDIITLPFEVRYSSADSLYFQTIVVNEVSSL